jgi:hypothetical protein
MAIIGVVVWVAYQTHAWWSYLLWYLVVLLLSICWVLYPLQSTWKKMLWPVSAAMLVGSIVVASSTLLCLPTSVFMTVYSVLMASLTASMIQTMVNYQRSLHDPKTQNLTWRERVLPQIRSMAQPMVAVIPTLFAGMLLGGVSVIDSLIVVLLLTAASFVANVLAGVVALRIMELK